MPSPAKIKSIIGWVLSGLVGLVLIGTAILKFTGAKEVMEGFSTSGWLVPDPARRRQVGFDSGIRRPPLVPFASCKPGVR